MYYRFILICSKINAPQVVQEKILSLIQDWADAFRNSPDMTHVLQTYEALKKQGVVSLFDYTVLLVHNLA